MAEGSRLTRQGRYLAVITGIARSGKTGCLRVSGEGAQRLGLVVDGQLLLWVDVPEGFEASAGPPPKGSGLSGTAGETLWALISAQELAEDPAPAVQARSGGLEEFLSRQCDQGIAQPLAWSDIECHFEALPQLPRQRWDPGLASGGSLLRGLWAGARQSLAMDQLLSVVVDPSAGKVEAAADLEDLLAAFEVGSPLDQLGPALKKAKEVEELLSDIPDRSGHLVALLWVLELVGAISRSGRTLDAEAKKLAAVEGGRKPTKAPKGKPKPQAAPKVGSKAGPASTAGPSEAASATKKPAGPPTRGMPAGSSGPSAPADKVEELLRTVHLHRMGKDYFEFLDLTPSATPSQVLSACQRLCAQWEKALATPGLSEEGKAQARELLHVAGLVESTLSDASSRREYVGQLRGGTHLRTGEAPSPSADADLVEPTHAEARSCLANGEFRRARVLLEALRRDHPSSAPILTDLGWAVWNENPAEEHRESATEYLRLALTFDPNFSLAKKYLSKVSSAAAEAGGADSGAVEEAPKKKRGFWRRDG